MTHDTLPSQETINKTIDSLSQRGYISEYVSTKNEALARINDLMPAGVSIMNGASRTLEQIGFIDQLKSGNHKWDNLHESILAEKDPVKNALLRKQSVLSDFYLGSAHAITENGEIVIASNSGSQLPHLVYTSQNIILIVGTQKITSDLSSALNRLEDYVFPLEDARMKEVGMGGSFISKLLILKKEQHFMGRKFHIIFVGEKLGF